MVLVLTLSYESLARAKFEEISILHFNTKNQIFDSAWKCRTFLRSSLLFHSLFHKTINLNTKQKNFLNLKPKENEKNIAKENTPKKSPLIHTEALKSITFQAIFKS